MSNIEVITYPFRFFCNFIIDCITAFMPFYSVLAVCLICGLVMLIATFRGASYG